MIRISGIILPNDKRIEIALTYLYGIGLTRSKQILAECGIDPNIRTKDITEEQANIIRTATTKFKVEGDLKKEIQRNVNLMKEIARSTDTCFYKIGELTGPENIAKWEEQLETVCNRGFWDGYYLG